MTTRKRNTRSSAPQNEGEGEGETVESVATKTPRKSRKSGKSLASEDPKSPQVLEEPEIIASTPAANKSTSKDIKGKRKSEVLLDSEPTPVKKSSGNKKKSTKTSDAETDDETSEVLVDEVQTPDEVFKKPLPNASRPKPLRSSQSATGLNPVDEEYCSNCAEITSALQVLNAARNDLQAALTNTRNRNNAASEDESLAPSLWVNRWMDHSRKYGFGYELSDGSFGVRYNDNTKLTLGNDAATFHYSDKQGYRQTPNNASAYVESNDTTDSEHDLKKKIRLLNYFRNYMTENLRPTKCVNENATPAEVTPPVNLWMWNRTGNSVGMVLSNGTVQIHGLDSHLKFVICPANNSISLVEPGQPSRTYSLILLKKGSSTVMQSRLAFGLEKVEILIQTGTTKLQRRYEANNISN